MRWNGARAGVAWWLGGFLLSLGALGIGALLASRLWEARAGIGPTFYLLVLIGLALPVTGMVALGVLVPRWPWVSATNRRLLPIAVWVMLLLNVMSSALVMPRRRPASPVTADNAPLVALVSGTWLLVALAVPLLLLQKGRREDGPAEPARPHAESDVAAVSRVTTLSGRRLGTPYFQAACECGWRGERHDDSRSTPTARRDAHADLRGHRGAPQRMATRRR